MKILESFNEIKLKYDIIEAEDGIDLIKLVCEDQLNDNRIRAVFTDENMEYINGSEAIKILKDLERNFKIKSYCNFFSITAFEDKETKENILKSKVDEIISKPASKTQIKLILDKYDLF